MRGLQISNAEIHYKLFSMWTLQSSGYSFIGGLTFVRAPADFNLQFDSLLGCGLIVNSLNLEVSKGINI